MPKVNRKDFLQRLEEVRPGLSPREIIQQSSCFIFKGGWVYTYNEEVACKAPTGLPPAVEAAVKAEPLIQLMRKMTEEQILLKFDTGKNEVRVVGNGRVGGVGFEDKILLLTEEAVKPPDKWRKIPAGLIEAIETVGAFAGTDEKDFDFVCVNVRPTFVEACDRHQVARYTIDTGVEEGFLVRKDSVTGVVELAVDQMGVTDAWLQFRRKEDGYTYCCRRYPGDQYPDTTPIVATKGTPALFPKELLKAVEKAEIFSGENADDNFVLVKLDRGKLELRGTGVTGWYKETKRVTYDGPPMTFTVKPAVFSTLLADHTKCVISKKLKMKVDHEDWVYVACLEKEKTTPNPSQDPGE